MFRKLSGPQILSSIAVLCAIFAVGFYLGQHAPQQALKEQNLSEVRSASQFDVGINPVSMRSPLL